MEDACRQAGFNFVVTIEAPIASLMAFGLVNDRKKKVKNVLVFDMGGNTLEVTVLNNNNNYRSFVITAKNTDMSVNGRCFTKIIANYCLKSISLMDISEEALSEYARQMFQACENAKQALSSKAIAKVNTTIGGS